MSPAIPLFLLFFCHRLCATHIIMKKAHRAMFYAAHYNEESLVFIVLIKNFLLVLKLARLVAINFLDIAPLEPTVEC